MMPGTQIVETFRIVFSDPKNEGRLNIFSCKCQVGEILKAKSLPNLNVLDELFDPKKNR